MHVAGLLYFVNYIITLILLALRGFSNGWAFLYFSAHLRKMQVRRMNDKGDYRSFGDEPALSLAFSHARAEIEKPPLSKQPSYSRLAVSPGSSMPSPGSCLKFLVVARHDHLSFISSARSVASPLYGTHQRMASWMPKP
jgi:hypothetical protein